MAIRAVTNDSGLGNVPECDQAWAALPAKMHEEYVNPEFLDSGRRGCAFKVHERQTDTDVLVKVGKLMEDNTADWWQKYECDPMKEMHKLACKKGKPILDLAEKYLPSCIDFMPFRDSNGTQPYFTMHLAPTSQFEEVTSMKWELSHTARLFLFAELIESLYTLHELGYVHNDFKGANIMVAKPIENDIPEVAIIDFGRMQKGFHLSHYHDGSMLRKHLATALGCNGSGASSWFIKCLEDEWQMDPESLKVFSKWDKHLSGDVRARNAYVDQGSSWIYKTRFVQNVVQKLRQSGQKKHYIIDGSCL